MAREILYDNELDYGYNIQICVNKKKYLGLIRTVDRHLCKLPSTVHC